MGLVDKIKADVKKSGQNKGKFIYFREGEKQRFRFLTDMDDGTEVVFHDSFDLGINVPCQETFGKECEYCERTDLRTRSMYIWSVWDYEAKEVKLFMFAVNNCSPVPALMAMYENYGTITDRDFVITKTGKGQTTTYSVVPMDKVKFRNEKAKPITEKSILTMLNKAFPDDNADDDDDVEEETTKKRKSKPAAAKSKAKAKEEEPEEDEDYNWEDEEDEDDKVDYSELTPKELFMLCKEREIEALPKKPEKYYIKLLEEFDTAQDDWAEDEDEEEWE